MAAIPVSFPPTASLRRRPLPLTPRRIDANRRNATRSSGPRSAEGKARVARNAIKHGFFVAQDRWIPRQRCEFEETLAGLRDELQPQGAPEESCVETIAQSYVRMAAMLRYENIAARKHHQNSDRELSARIAAATPAEAAVLEDRRDQLRLAGLWRPTIPAPRQAQAIIRYGGSLDRAIRRASAELDGLQAMRMGGKPSLSKVQKQTHSGSRRPKVKKQKQTHFQGSAPIRENAKTNPLTSTFTGNRHQRRRAEALAKRERRRSGL
jgi:hypothetical protein